MTLVYYHKILGLATWGKCHVGSKDDMTLTWQEKMSQDEFWPAKAHIAGSLFMGHKFFLTDIAWPIISFLFFGPYFL